MATSKPRFRSKFERRAAERLKKLGIPFRYEQKRDFIDYEVPARLAIYKPDFVIPGGPILETKGRLTVADRKKHLLLKEQFPELDLRFVFQRGSNPIRKGSKTSYLDWCERHGIPAIDFRDLDEEWLSGN